MKVAQLTGPCALLTSVHVVECRQLMLRAHCAVCLFYLEKRFNNTEGLSWDKGQQLHGGLSTLPLVFPRHKNLLRAPLWSEDLCWRRLLQGPHRPVHTARPFYKCMYTLAHMHTCILQFKDFFKNTQMLPEGRVSVGRGGVLQKACLSLPRHLWGRDGGQMFPRATVTWKLFIRRRMR